MKNNIVGKTYTVSTGVQFKVTSIEKYPASKISKQYKGLLLIESGLLVAINYRGTLIPNITLKTGVARITSIEVEGKVFKKPSTISEALGIKNAIDTYLLTEIT